MFRLNDELIEDIHLECTTIRGVVEPGRYKHKRLKFGATEGRYELARSSYKEREKNNTTDKFDTKTKRTDKPYNQT